MVENILTVYSRPTVGKAIRRSESSNWSEMVCSYLDYTAGTRIKNKTSRDNCYSITLISSSAKESHRFRNRNSAISFANKVLESKDLKGWERTR